MFTGLRVALLQFFLQPLSKVRDKLGDALFQVLFYNRTEGCGQVEFALERFEDMTIIGNPGEGKSSLMHYMVIEAKKSDRFFPIILDWSRIRPRSTEGMIIRFIEKMEEYFKEIDRPFSRTERLNKKNLDSYFSDVGRHLDSLNVNELKKKLVIFLDDLDHMENNYFNFLKKYFVTYASSERSIVVLSGRKPLINTIRRDPEMRQAFTFNPRIIHLVRVDIQEMIQHRLLPLVSNPGSRNPISRFTKRHDIKSKLKTIGKIVSVWENEKLEVIRELRQKDSEYSHKNDKFEVDETQVNLPFNPLFYQYLGDITGRNVKNIEAVLPAAYQYQIANQCERDDWTDGQCGIGNYEECKQCSQINFNNNFYESFILCFYKKEYLLLDLVSWKTINTKNKLNNNSILQIVLEFFYQNDIKNGYFCDEMARFGICADDAGKALDILISADYSLLDPDFAYDLKNNVPIKRYKINRKGKMYLNGILKIELYYDKLRGSKSARKYIEDQTVPI